MRFAEVAVDAPAGYSRTFSYSIPPHLAVRPGHLVRVPFGPRTLPGVVFAVTSYPQVAETRDVLEVTGHEPVLTPTQLDLARWLGHYYVSELFEAAALMLAPGARVRARVRVSLTDSAFGPKGAGVTPLQRRVLDHVGRHKNVDQQRVIEAIGPSAERVLSQLVDRGLLTRTASHRRPTIGPRYVYYTQLLRERRREATDWLSKGGSRAPRQSEFLNRLIRAEGLTNLADARRQYGRAAVDALLRKGWVEKTKVALERDPLADKHFAEAPPVTLTPRQMEATSQIRAVMGDGSAVPRAFLLQGVTGSGKTEIYLDAVGHCLDLGKRAIVLVPEIALTHQTVERFAVRFPGRVAVLHSGLSSGERFDQWWKIRRGEYGVVIGSRSAIFAPLSEVGIVVLDEEHEWTYKQQDASPRYHARDVAFQLSELTGAVVLLGSATPDVVSFHRALGRHLRLLDLPDRIPSDHGGALGLSKSAPLAAVEVVDMKTELRQGNADIFSRALVAEMEKCLQAGDQTILFLNRRGSSSHTQCRVCGHTLRCRRCDVSLTYHAVTDRMVCHYCGYRRVSPAECPNCRRGRMGRYGVGTQAVAEEVGRRFPDARTIRLDRDATRGAKAYERAMEEFGSNRAQILVGTQMIAKGLHFPRVSLVGVVLADVGLGIPDYRAGERAFQLLCQVSGRAGRGVSGGKVILQTYQPDNYAVRAGASQDYQRFYAEEMAFRRQHGNPPVGKLIRVLYTHTNPALCEREVFRFSTAIKRQREVSGRSDIEVVGPAPAYPPRLKGRYRWHLVLRGPEPRQLLDEVSIPPGWIVDVDPVALT